MSGMVYSYFPGGYFDADGAPHFLHTDYQGSVVMVTDSAGCVEQHTAYYPYGEPHREPAGQPILYAGKERLRTTADLAYGARRHHAPLINWTVPDPKAHEQIDYSPYSMCYANPIQHIDFDGEKPGIAVATLMCMAAYEDENFTTVRDELIDLKWNISGFKTSIKMCHPAKSGIGMQSILFEKNHADGRTEYAYVYAGTNCWEDGVEDLIQLIGFSPQTGQAIENAKKLTEELGDAELTFLGHSEGGFLASVSSAVTGKDAITFNTAVASPATLLFHNIKLSGNVDNYISGTPPIFGYSSPIDPVTNLLKSVGLIANGNKYLVHIGFLPSHKIKDLVKKFYPNIELK